ncbi:MAG: GHMP kinase [Candidatus Liptonbacteria bacterium]
MKTGKLKNNLAFVKVPMRLEFLGGSTDISSFYTRYTGHVLNAAINKYIYVLVRRIGEPRVRLCHEEIEDVKHSHELVHNRTRAALAEYKINQNIEIVSLTDIPGGSGLGSSSSFSVAILQALSVLAGKPVRNAREVAEQACRLEIDILKEPIGKQDQYGAAFGGINLLTFNKNGWVDRKHIVLSKEVEREFYKHFIVFNTGKGHSASRILGEQKKTANDKFKYLKQMSDLVPDATRALQKGDLKLFAEFLYKEWMIKKNLTAEVTTPQLEKMYKLASSAGAWGGRVSGAGGGGFMFLLAPPGKHAAIKKALKDYAIANFRFTGEGAKTILIK